MTEVQVGLIAGGLAQGKVFALRLNKKIPSNGSWSVSEFDNWAFFIL